MQQSQGNHEQRLTAAAASRARAEHAEWAEMLAYSDHLTAEYAQTSEYFTRQAQLRSIALEIAVAMNLSEGQVHRRLSCAGTVRDQAPAVWAAFAEGVVDAYRVTMIADTIDKLVRPASVAKLDAKVVAYARTHTSVELRGWLRRFVARVEADLFVERAEAERADRRVEVAHGEDGMSWLSAYLPSHVAAAIGKRLTFEARKITDDDRTVAQRRADLLASWLTTNESGEPAVGADIAVSIPATTLAGMTQNPAIAADGTFIVPAHWVTDPDGHQFWHTIITGRDGNVLEHWYHGRFAPETLKKALVFKHGVCQAPTCTTSADQCQFDHRQPWPHGQTVGANLWPLCERHHQMKSHDVITWTLPSGHTHRRRTRPARRLRTQSIRTRGRWRR